MRLGTVLVHTPVGKFERVVVATSEGLIDATAARTVLLERNGPVRAAKKVAEAQSPPDLTTILSYGQTGLHWVREAVAAVSESGSDRTDGGQRVRYQPSEVTMLAPLPRPPSITCGTTWEQHIRHAEEKGSVVRWPEPGSRLKGFYKANTTTVAGHGTTVPLPPFMDDDLDIECELAAVVGEGGANFSVEDAKAAIAGYCIFNDISIRKRQRAEMRLGLGPTTGKDTDGGNILGPWLVTADEVGDVGDLTMSIHVNGQEWSTFETSKMAWPISDILAHMSQGQHILPGSIVTSGSYPGGCGSDLGRTLKPGDTFEARISRIGILANRFAET